MTTYLVSNDNKIFVHYSDHKEAHMIAEMFQGTVYELFVDVYYRLPVSIDSIPNIETILKNIK